MALCFRHSLVREHLVWIGVAKVTMTIRVDDITLKLMNDCKVDDEVPHPGNVQLLDLQFTNVFNLIDLQ